jgi:NADH-quinone oxidoreductase subunit A
MIWPVVVYGALVVALVAAMVVLSYLLGPRHAQPGRNQPYESGIPPIGSAHFRYVARYYMVGVFFILFDVEAAILFTWAVAFREVGWSGYITAALFVVTLAAGLVYVWKLGGLDWYGGRPVIRQAQDASLDAQRGDE